MEVLQVVLASLFSAVILFLIAKVIGHKQVAQLEFFDYITGITIVLGIIIILMALAITNGKKGLLKKVIWVILAVSFTLMAIEALLPAENYWEYIEHVSDLIIAIFMLLLVAEVEVRIAMGAKS